MNEISELLNFIIERFQADSLVNTITMQSNYDLDSQKENLYLLVNINYKEADVQTDTIIAYFEITILQQREVQPVATDSKLMFDTNLIDNLNETMAVGNKFVKYLNLKNNLLNAELDSITRFTTIKERPANNVDGYKFSCGISIPNKTSAC
jgi:hypothetical protein